MWNLSRAGSVSIQTILMNGVVPFALALRCLSGDRISQRHISFGGVRSISFASWRQTMPRRTRSRAVCADGVNARRRQHPLPRTVAADKLRAFYADLSTLLHRVKRGTSFSLFPLRQKTLSLVRYLCNMARGICVARTTDAAHLCMQRAYRCGGIWLLAGGRALAAAASAALRVGGG